mmetsp:Transcript_19339/g.53790  ORF Transcript_19339/g.53790 Transcript_19339/m.53790 type:complete len:219 (+) Transcript_19339:915-1571(+)
MMPPVIQATVWYNRRWYDGHISSKSRILEHDDVVSGCMFRIHPCDGTWNHIPTVLLHARLPKVAIHATPVMLLLAVRRRQELDNDGRTRLGDADHLHHPSVDPFRLSLLHDGQQLLGLNRGKRRLYGIVVAAFQSIEVIISVRIILRGHEFAHGLEQLVVLFEVFVELQRIPKRTMESEWCTRAGGANAMWRTSMVLVVVIVGVNANIIAASVAVVVV